MEQTANGSAASTWTAALDRMRAQAGATPDALAVEAQGRTMTYAALAARVDALSARLAPHLPAPEMAVAVCLERSVDLPAWLLALFALGAAYVPIDPSLPPARISHVLDGAAPAFILTSRSLIDRLPATPLPVVIAEALAEAPATAAAPIVPLTPVSLAYVLFTSGSTGRPKGVEIEHGALMALIDSVAHGPTLARGQTLMGLTRLGFDISVLDIFLPLSVGARLVLIDMEQVVDCRQLAAAIAHHRPDMMQATPATWRALVESGWSGSARVRILCGGEAMSRDLADRLLPRCRDLWNVYGPTETTVWSTRHRVTPGTGLVPVGKAIDGTFVRILDPALKPVAAGEVGEIAIGGAGVGRGYRDMPELTAERFVTLDDGARAYRTSDLGRIGADGDLYCLGRLDDQVKIRGVRIELGDVECALSRHPAVAWSAARAWPAVSGENILTGYAVARDGCALTADEIKAAMAKDLPAYMIPDIILLLDRMPLTPNRKIDHAALPNPFDRAGTAPLPQHQDPVERQLAAIWCDLLGLEHIGRDDDFFDLGGYSLITVRLLCHIEERFGPSLEIADIMQASTLAAMAARIADADAETAGPVMLLNDGGGRPPLYWLDAGPLMRGMARAVPPGQPVFSLNLTQAEERRLAHGPIAITAVAATLRCRLLEAQPEGPYYIGGWCRWGVVAHELACQLQEQGAAVALLVLLDAAAPAVRPHRDATRAGLAALRRLIGGERSNPDGRPSGASFSEAVLHAGYAHRPRRFDGDALLIRAADATYPRSGGWSGRIGRILEERTTGSHESMVRHPHVAHLASVLDQGLISAQAAVLHEVAKTPSPQIVLPGLLKPQGPKQHAVQRLEPSADLAAAASASA